MSLVMMDSGGTPMSPDTWSPSVRRLKLFGMAHALDELATQSSPLFTSAEPLLSTLIDAEFAEREAPVRKR